MYTYGCFMLRFDRKQQNSVKQLSFNKKINLKKRNIKKKSFNTQNNSKRQKPSLFPLNSGGH